MFQNSFATHTLGLELDNYTLKGVALSCSRRSITVESVFEFSFVENPHSDQNVKLLYTEEQKKQLQLLSHKALLVTSLPSQDVLIRPLSVKIKNEKNIDEILAFQAEPLLPYPVENALLDKIVLAKDKEGTEIALFAVRKNHLSEKIKQWNNWGIEPEVVTAAPAALALFSKTFTTSIAPFFSLYLGYSQSFCLLMDQGKLLGVQTVPIKMDSILTAFASDSGLPLQEALLQMNHPDFTLPSAENSPALNRAWAALCLGISHIFQALAKQPKGREAATALILGDVPQTLKEHLSRTLNKPLLTLHAPEGFEMPEKQLEKFCLCIGGALTGRPGNKDLMNFRQKEFEFPDFWKRLRRPVILYLLLCLGAAAALTIFSRAEVRYEEAQIRQHYLELLRLMNKPYAQFETEYLNKNPAQNETRTTQNLADLSPEQVKQRLIFLEKELQATPQIYPLQPNVPLVSDLLAWIAMHPGFKESENEAGLQIESLSYSVVKRPEPLKKQEKYQIKVELEFSSPTPKMAREFHDALIAPNEMVDPKGEIKWNSNRDRYRTSFYLKDKTVYPTP